MLSARAYSFAYKSRLAVSLSWVGGFTNVVALLACGTVVSHVTGTTTYLARALGEHAWAAAAFPAMLWLTFLAGAAASAVMTESARRRGMASKYVQPIAVEAVLLGFFAWGVQHYLHAAGEVSRWTRRPGWPVLTPV